MEHQRGGAFLRRAAPFLSVAALVAGSCLYLRRFERYAITGASMEPALVEGDWAIIDRRAYRHQPPGAGDVLMVKDPRLPERTLVKRAAGRDGASTRVIGDNAAQSTDSRVFGAVPDELLVGRVLWRYWPLRRFGRVA